MKKGLIVLMTAILTAIMISPVTVKASNEDDVLAYINSMREAAGLEQVTMDADLQAVAAIRAQECAQKFSHTRPNGKAWYTVSSLTVAENLAHAVNYNQQKPENVVYAWMLSPSHSANVLKSKFTVVGISYYCNDSGETFIACEFR